MAKKKVSIDYTSRDFNSIKGSLVDYAKRYYPETYQDFNEASFGSLMLDTVSYVGDILSYYLDYQVNESFLDTAFETQNIIKISRQLGYKYEDVSSAVGEISLYALIPPNALGLGPDANYYPIIRQGSSFSVDSGNTFTSTEDIRFDNPANEIVIGRVNEASGLPTSYAVKAKGKIISGEIVTRRYDVGNYERFRKIDLDDTNIVEILSVEDGDGNEYFQVDNLTQNTIYKSFPNVNQNSDTVKEFLRPVIVPRRYIYEYDGSSYYLQFGYGSEEKIKINPVADPSSVALKLHARDYVTDVNLDPSKLLETDKLGVSPSDTQLTIIYRKNTNSNSNAKTGTIKNITNLLISFEDISSLSSSKISVIRRSMESSNENPVVGSSVSQTGEEIKQRALSHFATQNRAVTINDYESMVYSMPAKFGSITRCNIILDQDSFKRNLNLYMLSTDKDDKLVLPNNTLKENAKVWISSYKMVNDTVDIINAKIINIGINFEIISDPDYNKSDIYAKCVNILSERYKKSLQMGEPFYITDIYYELNRVRGVVDTQNVFFTNKTGGRYSDITFSIEQNMSADGRYLSCPSNVCYEIKFPQSDIKGVVK